MHLHATVTARPGKLAELIETTAWIARGMTGRGWRLVGSYQSLDPAREEIVDVWEMRDANAVVDAFEEAFSHPAHERVLARLALSVERELVRLVVPALDAPTLPTSVSCKRFLHSSMAVRYGSVAAVEAAVTEIRELLEATAGWRLIGGYRTLIGDLGELFYLWEIPPAQSIGDLIADAFKDPAIAATESAIEPLLERRDWLEMERTSFAPVGLETPHS
jgi:hypothetical protein